MNSLISVIVPVYNAERYLPKCVESIIKQTYKNIEIILIDDGSTDNSGKICDEYAKLDNRIKVIHKKNGGVSSARNKGLKEVQGQYIHFVDSDDFISPKLIQLLFKEANKYSAEFVAAGFSRESNLPVGVEPEVLPPDFMTETNVEFINTFLDMPTQIMYTPWAKLYKKEIIQNNNITFPEDIDLGEDLLFNLKYYTFVKKGVFLNKSLYSYRFIENSLSQKFRKNALFIQLRIHSAKIEFLKQACCWSEETSQKVNYIFCLNIMEMLECLIHSNLPLREKYQEYYIILNTSKVQEAFTGVIFTRRFAKIVSPFIKTKNVIIVFGLFKTKTILKSIIKQVKNTINFFKEKK